MNEILKKVLYIVAAIYFILSLVGGGIQTYRLERSMAECRQYREQLAIAENRESEVRAAIDRTSLILGQTTNSIGELREKLKEVENSYNYMWQLLYDDDNIIYNGENQIKEK